MKVHQLRQLAPAVATANMQPVMLRTLAKMSFLESRASYLSASSWHKFELFMRAMDDLQTSVAHMTREEGKEKAVLAVRSSVEYCHTREEKIQFLHSAAPAISQKVKQFGAFPRDEASQNIFKAARAEIGKQLVELFKPESDESFSALAIAR